VLVAPELAVVVAGADHVCLQPVGHGGVPLDDYRALARVLIPSS
jgi:hypothetical protein